MIHIVAYAIATIIPLVVLYFIFTRDVYGTGETRLVIISFVWGAIAFAIASGINNYVGPFLGFIVTTRFFAPVIEELLKGSILVNLVRRPDFTYFVDGAIYGFAVGMGFAVFENYQYILNEPIAALDVAVGRVISTNLMHASASAVTGIAFGLSRFERTIGKVRIIVIGLAIAILLHMGFNNLVTRVSSGWLLLYAAAVGITSLLVIWAAIRRGLEDEKLWIAETLGAADRVTEGEAAVVQHMSDLEQLLDPLAKRFGGEKASQIEHFLTLQARLGIMRKTLEKLPDASMRSAVEDEMDELRAEMDVTRRAVGTFAMMYLRSIFPDEDESLWGHFEDVITQRAALNPSPEGGGLWGNLEKRQSQDSDEESV